eukprot:jgi/Bigna1/90739/estExt_fgenesh1_pg.C_780032
MYWLAIAIVVQASATPRLYNGRRALVTSNQFQRVTSPPKIKFRGINSCNHVSQQTRAFWALRELISVYPSILKATAVDAVTKIKEQKVVVAAGSLIAGAKESRIVGFVADAVETNPKTSAVIAGGTFLATYLARRATARNNARREAAGALTGNGAAPPGVLQKSLEAGSLPSKRGKGEKESATNPSSRLSKISGISRPVRALLSPPLPLQFAVDGKPVDLEVALIDLYMCLRARLCSRAACLRYASQTLRIICKYFVERAHVLERLLSDQEEDGIDVDVDPTASSISFRFSGSNGAILRVAGLGGKGGEETSTLIYVLSKTQTLARIPVFPGEKRRLTITYSPPGPGVKSQRFYINIRRISNTAAIQQVALGNSTEEYELIPGFTPEQSRYSFSVPQDFRSMTLLVKAAGAGGSVSFGDSLFTGSKKSVSLDRWATSDRIVLAPGPNNIKINTVSEDRMERRTYTIRVVRESKHLVMNTAAMMLPKRDKILKGGEDAFAIAGPSFRVTSGELLLQNKSMTVKSSSTNGPRSVQRNFLDFREASVMTASPRASLIAVSDGVSAWDALGVDSGAYSRELMERLCDTYMAAEDEDQSANPSEGSVQNGGSGPSSPRKQRASRTALSLLSRAWKGAKTVGSATATLVRLEDTALSAAVVGDSQFVVIRDDKIIYTSPVQEIAFNTPYQLPAPDGNPSHLEFQSPKDARKITLRDMREGDVVILGTDGFFDNLFPEDIKRITRDVLKKEPIENVPAALTEALLEESFKVSEKITGNSPWAKEASREVKKEAARLRRAGEDVEYELAFGGKPDDITVVVGVVTN